MHLSKNADVIKIHTVRALVDLVGEVTRCLPGDEIFVLLRLPADLLATLEQLCLGDDADEAVARELLARTLHDCNLTRRAPSFRPAAVTA